MRASWVALIGCVTVLTRVWAEAPGDKKSVTLSEVAVLGKMSLPKGTRLELTPETGRNFPNWRLDAFTIPAGQVVLGALVGTVKVHIGCVKLAGDTVSACMPDHNFGLEGMAAKPSSFGGVRFAPGLLRFHVNSEKAPGQAVGSVTGAIDNAQRVGGYDLPSGTLVHYDVDSKRLFSVTAATPLTIGLVELVGAIRFSDEGVRGTLAKAVSVSGVPCESGKEVALDPKSNLHRCHLTRSVTLGGVPCAAAKEVVLWPQATLEACELAKATVIQGLPVKGRIELDEQGAVVDVVLSKAHSNNGIRFPAGSRLQFEEGRVRRVELPRAAVLKVKGGIECISLEADEVIELNSNGRVDSCVLAKAKKFRGGRVPARSEVTFYETGEPQTIVFAASTVWNGDKVKAGDSWSNEHSEGEFSQP